MTIQTPSSPSVTLEAFNVAYAEELRKMYESLPFREGDRLIDIGCGNGSGSFWRAKNARKAGLVMAIDVSSTRLSEAAERVAPPKDLRFCRANGYRLPFRDGSFDAACSTHSLITLRKTEQFLAETMRVVRPGGWLAFVEIDAMHHVLLPWPVELEIELQAAAYRAHSAISNNAHNYYLNRIMPEMLRTAGLRRVDARPWIIHRSAPLNENVQNHLLGYFADLRHDVESYLAPRLLDEFDALTRPSSEDFLLDHPGFNVTILDWLIRGEKTR